VSAPIYKPGATTASVTAASAAAAAASTAATAAAGLAHPGLVTGRWYGPQLGSQVTNAAMAANVLYAYPILVPTSCTLAGLAMRIGTQSVGTGKLGIYANASGVPGTLVAEATQDGDFNVAVTTLDYTFSANPALSAGWHWFASCFSAATATPVTYSSAPAISTLGNLLGHPSSIGVLASGTSNGASRLFRTAALTYVAATAFFPASFGAVSYGVNTPGMPIIAYQLV